MDPVTMVREQRCYACSLSSDDGKTLNCKTKNFDGKSLAYRLERENAKGYMVPICELFKDNIKPEFR